MKDICVERESNQQYRELLKEYYNDYRNKIDFNLEVDNLEDIIPSKVPLSFLTKYRDYISWWDVSYLTVFPISFIEENKDYINWGHLLENNNFSEEFYRQYIDKICWYSLCLHRDLSKKFIMDFHEKIRWDAILENNQYRTNRDFMYVFDHEFLDAYIPRDLWWKITDFRDIPEAFLGKNYARFSWQEISKKKDLSLKFMKKHAKRLKFYLLLEHHNDLEKVFKVFTEEKKDWKIISSREDLSMEFIFKYKRQLHLHHEYFYINKSFTNEDIEKLGSLFNLDHFCAGAKISEDNTKKYIKSFNWDNISRNARNISLMTVWKHKAKITFWDDVKDSYHRHYSTMDFFKARDSYISRKYLKENYKKDKFFNSCM